MFLLYKRSGRLILNISLILLFCLISKTSFSSNSSPEFKTKKKAPFLELVNNEITFSTETEPVTAKISPENISKGVAKNVTPETTFSSKAPPKITLKLSPIEGKTIKKTRISLTFKLLATSGKRFSATLKNIKFKKYPLSGGLKIEIPSDNIKNPHDDLIDFVFRNTKGSLIEKVSGKISNNNNTGPISSNGTDTLSFDSLVFKKRIVKKLKEYISDVNLAGSFTYTIILTGTSIAVDTGDGKYKAINSITGNITIQ